MAHEYDGTQASRAMRKRSKLGKDGITLDRLEELLGSECGSGNRDSKDLNPHKQDSTDTQVSK